ncbi:hypothetical protein I551_8233 [Mycobacterium ulcerans str. Harvey]|uniref:Uncharacterized protein n=1 Tax=Mycobacterium ulcerans str. Harvey TaxID=1299332 RepID=A0ABP3A3P1_MYCUL|nr:hypothetical protein I551_8233 [Mycobacterium ulcerans str. Harvey]
MHTLDLVVLAVEWGQDDDAASCPIFPSAPAMPPPANS